MKTKITSFLIALLFSVNVLAGNSGHLTQSMPPAAGPGAGDVVGPGVGGSTDNAVARFNGVDGNIQNSGVILDDLNSLSGLLDVLLSGLLKFQAGEAITAGEYQFGRNTDATNSLEANVPVGAFHKWSIDGLTKLSLSNNSNKSILEISSGVFEDPFFRLSDDDIAHGITSFLPTNTILEISPYSSSTGPANIKGASQGDNPGLVITTVTGTPGPSATTPSLRFDLTKAGPGTSNVQLGQADRAWDIYSSAENLLTMLGDGKTGFGVTPTATLHIQQKQETSGTPTVFRLIGASNTNMTGSVEAIDLDLNLNRTINYAAGNLAFHRVARLAPPRIGFAGASIVTEGATLSIAGAPTPGSNATFTNNSTLLLESGLSSGTTSSYGLTVNTNTGGSNNYAARFLGGAVGFGTSAPLYPAQFSGTPTNRAAIGITPSASANGDALILGTLPSIIGNLIGFNFTATATGSFTSQITNLSNASSTANAVFKAIVGGASGGDPLVTYTVSGVTDWTQGIDNSDGDSFKISSSNTLGTNDRLTISTSGDVRILGTTRLDGRLNLGKGTNTASANNLTLPTDGHLISISGTTTINLIDSTGWQAGSEVRLQFLSAGCTIAHNQAPSGAFAKILVTGSGNYVSTANSQALLVYDGTNWYLTPGYAP